MSSREEFIQRLLDPLRTESVSALCAEFGISRKTAYKWRDRYHKEGLAGLEDRSRRPKRHKLETTADIVADIVALRRANPRYGPKKLRKLLERLHGPTNLPSVSTIDRVLRRCGEPRMKRRRRRHPLQRHPPAVVVKGCNDLWTIDFKGWWKTDDGTRVFPLTVRDAHSRFLLAVEMLENQRMESVRDTLLDLFRRYGLPKAMQSDNGSPFGSTSARGGLTRLSAWLVSIGINVVFSRPGCPQDNGGHERMHLDIRYDVEDHAKPTMREERDAAARWLHKFNHHRPHESLGQQTPAEVYRPSVRRIMGAASLPIYPAGWVIRRVGSPGRISVDGSLYHISAGLIGHKVALEPLEGTRVRVWFHDRDLGELDLSIVTQFRADQNVEGWNAHLAEAAK